METLVRSGRGLPSLRKSSSTWTSGANTGATGWPPGPVMNFDEAPAARCILLPLAFGPLGVSAATTGAAVGRLAGLDRPAEGPA